MANKKHMNKRGTKVGVKLNNFKNNLKSFFTKNSKDAKIHGIVLAFLAVVCVISGMLTFFLAKPAYELNISYGKATEAYSEVLHYTGGDEAIIAELQQKSDDAKTVYNSALTKYQNDGNQIISSFAKASDVKAQAGIMLLICIPFLVTAWVAIKHPLRTFFAILNFVVIYPGLLIKKLVKNAIASIKEAKENKKVSSSTEAVEAE